MQNDNKLIIVCSKNKAKNEAVKNVMMQYFKDLILEVFTHMQTLFFA